MAYRNKTFVSFASDDINYYRMMQAWRDNEHIEFNFHDAHDLNVARDTSSAETINRRLSERLMNTKQVVMLLSTTTKPKAADTTSFLYHEVSVIQRLKLPVVFVNLNQSREVQRDRIPTPLIDLYSVMVSCQPKIIQFALDSYVASFESNRGAVPAKTGPHYYKSDIYERLGVPNVTIRPALTR